MDASDPVTRARAERLLRDVNVRLDLEYAVPGQSPIAWLIPSIARYRELGLAESIVAGYWDLQDVQAREIVIDTLREALQRCAGAPLGVDRSLVIVDASFAITTESFSDDLWARLVFAAPQQELHRWLEALALRFLAWGVALRLPEPQWQRAVEYVHPRGLLPLLRWGVDHAWTLNSSQTVAQPLANWARQSWPHSFEQLTGVR